MIQKISPFYRFWNWHPKGLVELPLDMHPVKRESGLESSPLSSTLSILPTSICSQDKAATATPTLCPQWYPFLWSITPSTLPLVMGYGRGISSGGFLVPGSASFSSSGS